MAAQLAQEPVDPVSGGLDSALIRAAVREYCSSVENSEILIKDLLLHPSPVSSRRLSKLTFYGLNLHFELALIAWYFWTALQGTYVWMAWQTREEDETEE